MHQIEIKDIMDSVSETILVSSSENNKKLIMICYPYSKIMFFKVIEEKKDLCCNEYVFSFLKDAIKEYNKI